jgi:hypothetical protein
MRLINEHFWKFFVGLMALIIVAIVVVVLAEKYREYSQQAGVNYSRIKDLNE